MPAIQLGRLKNQSAQLAQRFNDPAIFRRGYHEMLDFYADRAYRPGQAGEPPPLLRSYNVPKPVLRQVLKDLILQAVNDPPAGLRLCDALWQETPHEWLTHLDHMTNWKIKTFVPGHGPLGMKKDIILEAKYIRALEGMVKKVIRRGGTLRDELKQTLPPPFDKWQLIGSRFEANVRSSYKRQH